MDVWQQGRGFQYLVDWEGCEPEERSCIKRSFILDSQLLIDFYSIHPDKPMRSAEGFRGEGGYCKAPQLLLVPSGSFILLPSCVCLSGLSRPRWLWPPETHSCFPSPNQPPIKTSLILCLIARSSAYFDTAVDISTICWTISWDFWDSGGFS